ncbi:hypothetical protein QBC43DRAFT_328393 [Cladorrhinum sp. PSN259]|nr:hypothetical protein QBC43DRAFT_328393 [Cladorrhinum sp. PSN259]
MEQRQEQQENKKKTVRMIAQCLCKMHSFTRADFPLPDGGSSPLKAITCHCNSCRHVSGCMSGSRALLWNDDEPDMFSDADMESSSGRLRVYKYSESMTLVFCGRCSSPLFARDAGSSPAQKVKLWVCTGVLMKHNIKLEVDWGYQVFVGDTVDGGVSNWLKGKRWLGAGGKSEEVKEEGEYWPAVESDEGKKVGDMKGEFPGNVRLKCHCGGVDFLVKAGEAQREFEEQAKKGEEKLPWFVDEVTHKSLGTLDGCDSCRVWSGVEVMNWTFALLKHIGFGDGSEGFPADTRALKAAVGEDYNTHPEEGDKFGTLAYYASSPDVQRYFCSRCAACVFYCVDDRPEQVDVAVGLLHAQEGARAERMISWEFGGQISFREDMAGTWRENLLDTVERESEEWRVKRGYPMSWRRTAKEAADGNSQ